MNRMIRLVHLSLAACLLFAALPAHGQDNRQAPPAKKDPKTGALIVPLQGSVRIQMKTKKLLRNVYFDRENVVQVLPDAANPDQVVIFGRGVGACNLELTDTDGTKETYEVVVQQDIDLLRNLIKRAVPTANVEVIPGIGGVLIISGNVPHPDDVDTILRIANAIGGQSGSVVNAMTIGGVHQVQLDVTIASVNRTKSRVRGFNFGVQGGTVQVGSVLNGVLLGGQQGMGAVATGVGFIPVPGTFPTGVNANIAFGIVPAQFQGFLQALKTESLAKLLAEPKLVTQSGRPARFLSGGQQPVVSAAAGINGPGVEFRDVGTELDFLPIVYGNGKIFLQVSPRIRNVNISRSLNFLGNTQVPGFDEQSVTTTVVMEAGQTLAIGGLIQTTVQATATKVPVLGELPFVGTAFNNISFVENEQELVILVTPHLVDPMDCNQVPRRLPGAETRSPDDFELYLETMLELPRGQRNVFEGKRYKAPWKNDPTAVGFPCGGMSGGVHGSSGNCATGTCNTGGSTLLPTSNITITGPSHGGSAAMSPTVLPGIAHVEDARKSPSRIPEPKLLDGKVTVPNPTRTTGNPK